MKNYEPQERLDALRYYLGYTQDGSSSHFNISLDDATGDFIFKNGGNSGFEYCSSFNGLLDKLVERMYQEQHVDPLPLSEALINKDKKPSGDGEDYDDLRTD